MAIRLQAASHKGGGTFGGTRLDKNEITRHATTYHLLMQVIAIFS